MSRWYWICLWGYRQWLFDYIVILNFSKFIDQYLTISSVMFQPCSNYKPLATKLTSKHPIIRWSWWNQTEDQTGPIQIHHLWGRHWTHSFSWKPSSSSVLNFFPQPRQTFVCERKPWEFVSSSRLRCWFNVFQRPCGWGHVVQDLLRSRNSEKGKLSLVNLKSAGASFRTCIWKKSYDGTNLTTLKTFRTGVTVLGADMAHLM